MSIQVISPETDVAKTTEVSPDQTVVSNPSVSKKVSAQVASTQAPVKATAAAALAKKDQEEEARQAQIAEAADQAAETVAEEQVAESGETVEATQTIATVAEEIDASSETLAGLVADAPMMFAQAGAAAAGGAAGGISTAAIVAGVAVVGVAAAASSDSSSSTAVTTTTTTTTTGASYILTVGADLGSSFTGTAGNDTFVGSIDDNTAANDTFTALDVLDGGAGTADILSITADTSAGALAFPAATVSNIENILLRNISGQTFTFNTALVTGETLIVSDRSTSNVVLTNVAAGTTLEVRGNEVATNADLTAGFVAAATSATVNITNGTTAGDIAVNGTAAALTTLVINSSGANNTVGNITSDGQVTSTTINATTNLVATSLGVATNSASQSLTITGAGNVTLGTLDADIVTVTATTMTGALTATLSATTTASLSLGSGNDVITTSTTGHTGVVNAGGGTGDVLILDATADIDSAAEGAVYTNFEIVRVSDGQTADGDFFTTSVTGIQIVDASAAATIVNDMTAAMAANVTFRDFHDAATLTVKNASTVGQNDVLNITISDGDTTTSETLIAATTDGADWTIAGVETINLTVVDDFDADAMNSITGMTTLTATGAGDVDIVTGALAMGTNGSINFSGVTGTIVFNAAALATNAFAYTGGSGVDTFTSGAISGSVINTGAGNDVLTLTAMTGGTTATTVTGGAGQDDIAVNVIGNGANDALVFTFSAGDSISDSSTHGISTTLTDTISNLDGTAAATNAGHASIEFDTNVAATAVTAGTTDVVLGTTTVTNAGDFFINVEGATDVYIYQDTDGDRIIEAGEFALHLSAIQVALVAGEFSVTGGDLFLITA